MRLSYIIIIFYKHNNSISVQILPYGVISNVLPVLVHSLSFFLYLIITFIVYLFSNFPTVTGCGNRQGPHRECFGTFPECALFGTLIFIIHSSALSSSWISITISLFVHINTKLKRKSNKQTHQLSPSIYLHIVYENSLACQII